MRMGIGKKEKDIEEWERGWELVKLVEREREREDEESGKKKIADKND